MFELQSVMNTNRKSKILIAGSLSISNRLFEGSEDENEDKVFELQSVTKSHRKSKILIASFLSISTELLYVGSEDLDQDRNRNLDQDENDPNGTCNVNFNVEPTSIVTNGKLQCVQTSDLVS